MKASCYIIESQSLLPEALN